MDRVFTRAFALVNEMASQLLWWPYSGINVLVLWGAVIGRGCPIFCHIL